MSERKPGSEYVRDLKDQSRRGKLMSFRRTSIDYHQLCEATELFPGADGVRSYRIKEASDE